MSTSEEDLQMAIGHINEAERCLNYIEEYDFADLGPVHGYLMTARGALDMLRREIENVEIDEVLDDEEEDEEESEW